MPKFALTTLLILVAVAETFAEEPVETSVLRVMTFNVRYGTADDGPNAWEHRKDLLIDTIKEAAPDILGTQECLDFQATYIVAQLPEYDWFGRGREADGSGEHMAVFFRKSILKPIQSGHFWLSETPDTPGSMSWNTACTRMVTWMRFTHLPTGTEIEYYNTHLDHRSALARLNGAQLIAKRLSEAARDTPLILTGDFNCGGGQAEPWHCLINGGMNDAWDNCGTRTGPATTWCGFEAPTDAHDRRIDWILIRGPLQAISVHTLTTNIDGRYPSDHFPVIATLRLENATVSTAPAP